MIENLSDLSRIEEGAGPTYQEYAVDTSVFPSNFLLSQRIDAGRVALRNLPVDFPVPKVEKNIVGTRSNCCRSRLPDFIWIHNRH